MKMLEDMVRAPPPELQQEVRDFAECLLERRARPVGRKLRLSWAGGLRELRDQFTSLELQKKALAWRGLMYLVDTNVWPELLLEQERAEEVRRFL
jgi:hypothetical protein